MSKDRLAEILSKLDAPTSLDRIDTTYHLVFRRIPGKASHDWHNPIPYWMTQTQGRDLALGLRDALRARGFDVEAIQKSTVTDVLE